MPKHDFLSPKAISNRIKSKGLQKLRWYCQMCQKQCRDENGFKCHMSSESHQRQLLLVAENPGKFIGSFSQEFFRDFMHLLRTSYGTRRVNANEVYQQYIKDKDHYHMNATRWETLTGFCMFLGREGICEVDPTPKGWFIKYIDRSPETLARQAAAEKKKKMDKDDEEKTQQAIEQQISRALASKKEEDPEPVYDDFVRENEEEKIVLSFKGGRGVVSSGEPSSSTTTTTSSSSSDTPASADKSHDNKAAPLRGSASASESSNGGKEGGFASRSKLLASGRLQESVFKASKGGGGPMKKKDGESRKRKLTALEEIREMEERKKEKLNRRDNWVTEGIIIKVMHQKLGEKFYKKKGVVEQVKDLYTAVVRMLETKDVIKIDQAYLETVLPALGKPVMVVNGAYRGNRAVLKSIDVDRFCATIKIDQGLAGGRIVERVPYEDISKLA